MRAFSLRREVHISLNGEHLIYFVFALGFVAKLFDVYFLHLTSEEEYYLIIMTSKFAIT